MLIYVMVDIYMQKKKAGKFDQRKECGNMYQIQNFFNNDDVRTIASAGQFSVLEYTRDLSVTPDTAIRSYYCDKTNIRKRQVACQLQGGSGVMLQKGAMQWMVGNVKMTTGIKGVGDFVKKAARGKVTGESAIKPEYIGNGLILLEPTYKYILLLEVSEWGKIVIDDGLFLACDASLKHSTVMRSNISSAMAGNEGLFNLALEGDGVLCLESRVPKEELIEVTLNNDTLKIDGNLAVAWSSSLEFTVERSGRSLIGSAASGEGLVNVYRGNGKVLMSPVT